jgi:hypothetical protein
MIPFVQNQSGFIAGSMLADLGRQAEEASDTRKRALQAGKAADAFFKALPEDQLPMPADVWHLQSPLEKASAMVGMIQAQGFKRQKLQADEMAEVIAGKRATRENAAREPAFLGDVARYAPPGALPYDIPEKEFNQFALPDGQEQVALPQLAASAARTGYQVPLTAADDVLRAAMPPGARGGREAFFKTDQFGVAIPIKTPEGTVLPGQRAVVTGPNSSVMMPEAGQEQPAVFTGSDGVSYYNKGTALKPHWQHLPFHEGMSDIDKVAAAAGVKAILDSGPALGLSSEEREKRVDAFLQRFQSGRGSADVLMFDKAGNKVRVPRTRMGEFSGKGYKLAQ